MNYFEALQHLLAGGKVRLKDWGEHEYAAFDDIENLVLIYPDGTSMLILKTEMMRNDWEVWEEKKKVTLSQLLETMQVVKKESGVMSHEEIIKKVWEKLDD